MSDVYGPWEQAENSDYDEQKPGSGDAHEDEFDDEYGEQRPHGDPDRPDNALEDAHQADIEYWEEVARLNAIAKPYDPNVKLTSDAAALSSVARPYDPAAPTTSDAATVDRFADELDDSSSVSLLSRVTSPDPDDFDWAEQADPAGPPAPGSGVAESNVSMDRSFDQFRATQAAADDFYQPAIFDPGGPAPVIADSDDFSFSGEMAPPNQYLGGDEPYQPAIVDPSAPAPVVADSDDFSFSGEMAPPNQYVSEDEPYQPPADSPAYAPEVDVPQNIGADTDWNTDIVG